MEFIEIKDLSFSYPSCLDNTLKNINLSIKEGDFVLLMGESGSGKSTLLRMLKREIAPYGKLSGDIFYNGEKLSSLNQRKSASEIGFVSQNPNYQIVTDKVWHELAFGLESLGFETEIIRRRVAEMASFFGIQRWFREDVKSLSGGQKQLLNLASIMTMQPKVLILDEPTAQLDPIAAKDFIKTIYDINREFGTTIILSEHRLEEVFPLVDSVAVLDKGEIIANGRAENIGSELYRKNHKMFYSLPGAIKAYQKCRESDATPLTIKEGRRWVIRDFKNSQEIDNIDKYKNQENKLELVEKKSIKNSAFSNLYNKLSIKGKNSYINRELCIGEMNSNSPIKREVIINIEDVFFRYKRDSSDVLRGVNLKIYENEFLCILGGNGTGKSTLLSIITAYNKPYRGDVYLRGKKINKYKTNELFEKNIASLPQDPQSLFVKNTAFEDLLEVFCESKISSNEINSKIENVIELLGIRNILNQHPYDLSGGEQQKLALGKILLLEPKIILLDEPTKGLDGGFKREMKNILKKLKKNGVTIVMVTHDIEFAAENADRCALFFDGNVVSTGEPREFFCGNSFYTTSINKMTRGILKNILVWEDLVRIWENQNH